MTGEQMQGLLGCAILALGFAILGKTPILGWLVLDLGAGLRAAGGVILADYALERVLSVWGNRRR